MYPRNAASPERIAIGPVILISDGTPQSSGVTVTVRGQGGAEAGSAGTIAYGATGVIVYYTPTQSETDFTSFTVTASKTGCIPACVTVITSASATPGYAGLDWALMIGKTTVNALTNTSIITTQKVDVDTIKTNPVVNAGTITFPTTATLASTTNITAGTIATVTNVTTVNGLAAGVITAASIAADAITDAKVASDVTIASVTGAVGSVTGAVGSVTGNVGGNVTGSVGSLAAQAKADVNTEVVDALATDTYAEPGQGTPAATASLSAKIGYLFKAWRNRTTQTATEYSLYNDNATTVDQKATVSDNGTTYDKTEVATGP